MLFVLFCYLTVMPLQVNKIDGKHSFEVVISLILDIVCIIDLLLTISTGYFEPRTGHVIFDRKAVFW